MRDPIHVSLDGARQRYRLVGHLRSSNQDYSLRELRDCACVHVRMCTCVTEARARDRVPTDRLPLTKLHEETHAHERPHTVTPTHTARAFVRLPMYLWFIKSFANRSKPCGKRPLASARLSVCAALSVCVDRLVCLCMYMCVRSLSQVSIARHTRTRKRDNLLVSILTRLHSYNQSFNLFFL